MPVSALSGGTVEGLDQGEEPEASGDGAGDGGSVFSTAKRLTSLLNPKAVWQNFSQVKLAHRKSSSLGGTCDFLGSWR
jgi:hypothetical protein